MADLDPLGALAIGIGIGYHINDQRLRWLAFAIIMTAMLYVEFNT